MPSNSSSPTPEHPLPLITQSPSPTQRLGEQGLMAREMFLPMVSVTPRPPDLIMKWHICIEQDLQCHNLTTSSITCDLFSYLGPHPPPFPSYQAPPWPWTLPQQEPQAQCSTPWFRTSAANPPPPHLRALCSDALCHLPLPHTLELRPCPTTCACILLPLQPPSQLCHCTHTPRALYSSQHVTKHWGRREGGGPL